MSKEKPAWYKRWWAVTAFVIIGLGIIGAIASPPEEEKVTAPSEKAKAVPAVEKATTTTAAKNGKIGEPIKVGEVEWLVSSAKKTPTLKSEFVSAKAGGVFVVVDLSATLRGKESGTIDDQQLKVVDDKGRTFSASSDGNVAMVMSDKWLFLKQVNPDVTVSGTAVFDVPADAAGLRLKIDDLRMLSSESEMVDLGL